MDELARDLVHSAIHTQVLARCCEIAAIIIQAAGRGLHDRQHLALTRQHHMQSLQERSTMESEHLLSFSMLLGEESIDHLCCEETWGRDRAMLQDSQVRANWAAVLDLCLSEYHARNDVEPAMLLEMEEIGVRGRLDLLQETEALPIAEDMAEYHLWCKQIIKAREEMLRRERMKFEAHCVDVYVQLCEEADAGIFEYEELFEREPIEWSQERSWVEVEEVLGINLRELWHRERLDEALFLEIVELSEVELIEEEYWRGLRAAFEEMFDDRLRVHAIERGRVESKEEKKRQKIEKSYEKAFGLIRREFNIEYDELYMILEAHKRYLKESKKREKEAEVERLRKAERERKAREAAENRVKVRTVSRREKGKVVAVLSELEKRGAGKPVHRDKEEKHPPLAMFEALKQKIKEHHQTGQFDNFAFSVLGQGPDGRDIVDVTVTHPQEASILASNVGELNLSQVLPTNLSRKSARQMRENQSARSAPRSMPTSPSLGPAGDPAAEQLAARQQKIKDMHAPSGLAIEQLFDSFFRSLEFGTAGVNNVNASQEWWSPSDAVGETTVYDSVEEYQQAMQDPSPESHVAEWTPDGGQGLPQLPPSGRRKSSAPPTEHSRRPTVHSVPNPAFPEEETAAFARAKKLMARDANSSSPELSPHAHSPKSVDARRPTRIAPKDVAPGPVSPQAWSRRPTTSVSPSSSSLHPTDKGKGATQSPSRRQSSMDDGHAPMETAANVIGELIKRDVDRSGSPEQQAMSFSPKPGLVDAPVRDPTGAFSLQADGETTPRPKASFIMKTDDPETPWHDEVAIFGAGDVSTATGSERVQTIERSLELQAELDEFWTEAIKQTPLRSWSKAPVVRVRRGLQASLDLDRDINGRRRASSAMMIDDHFKRERRKSRVEGPRRQLAVAPNMQQFKLATNSNMNQLKRELRCNLSTIDPDGTGTKVPPADDTKRLRETDALDKVALSVYRKKSAQVVKPYRHPRI